MKFLKCIFGIRISNYQDDTIISHLANSLVNIFYLMIYLI